ECDPGLLVDKVLQRQVSGVVAVRTRHCVRSICLHICKQDVKRNPFPRCTEFRPSRDAMYINCEGFGGQLAERLPIPSLQNVTAVVDHKFPVIEWHVWRRSCGQNGEVSSEVLPGWQLYICRAASTGKAS